jgi:hypothetical protein
LSSSCAAGLINLVRAEGKKGDLGDTQSVFGLHTGDDLFVWEIGLFEHGVSQSWLSGHFYSYLYCPTPSASATSHQPDRQRSKVTLNRRSWAGRLQSTLAHASFPHRRTWLVSADYGRFVGHVLRTPCWVLFIQKLVFRLRDLALQRPSCF